MFAIARATGTVFKCAVPVVHQQERGMATLKTISTRLKSVQNIKKITKSMKMVSAAKFARAERELKVARVMGAALEEFPKQAGLKQVEKPSKELVIAISSDKGLCGGIHSSIAKNLRAHFAANESANTSLIVIGDKLKGILARKEASRFLTHMTEFGKKPVTFGDASIVAQAILASPYQYDSARILFNKFKSAIAYDAANISIYSPQLLESAPELEKYEQEDDILRDYQEFHLASTLYYVMMEAQTSELSARMTAMDNASNNAGDMISRLSLLFNRTRQAVITRELIEIISGAAALE